MVFIHQYENFGWCLFIVSYEDVSRNVIPGRLKSIFQWLLGTKFKSSVCKFFIVSKYHFEGYIQGHANEINQKYFILPQVFLSFKLVLSQIQLTSIIHNASQYHSYQFLIVCQKILWKITHCSKRMWGKWN